MIKRILIANRGEIASRIIRTCKRLGITSIAVYSEADKEAPFVKASDEAYLLGASQVNESYMNIDKVFEVAKKSEADAIHPGYGFFSENAAFRERCEKAGICFIGPNSDVITQMGDKVNARNAMIAANVPVVPGTAEAITDVEQAVEFAAEIGYPIMLKAAAGGGGIGMQVVGEEEELRKVFTSNSERALNFFGNGSMFLERKIENAHHIEIQILADEHGNVVHLFDRECSIQRRNQKVIEEAPSPFISEETRNKMGEAAVQAAKALSYSNAGTIEFLVDEEENYYFLEMNTRVQVEHPVTEEITGIDIIEMQIRVANGEKLPFEQQDIKRSGHAIEARIYAEDPVRFFPSPGKITSVNLPEGEGIRHDIAFTENYQVTPFYDPMIGKLIVKGETREQAVNLLEQALENYQIDGIKTNLPMLAKTVTIPQFQKGTTTTRFVEDYYIPLIQNS
ncbi:acetyl-CoA carboxylase biotin carboxylase subunit [Oceanobacillus alkalisoli]|uniref:acetyl-CoA carboxylase biotin carboxylase subunit n=1 Tax=Oceanobacillus alkalisoli TaxID=2925113 RepID=UPI001EE46490|nr:acetyl-CoA carboxylase biotin carboxylase subunit [Oceanobacillus alkalisoli]MCG5105146.1 acetyl-CoA carboxylase biotin carboxylase subunit [Oceanobacillus alkalisoli]